MIKDTFQQCLHRLCNQQNSWSSGSWTPTAKNLSQIQSFCHLHGDNWHKPGTKQQHCHEYSVFCLSPSWSHRLVTFMSKELVNLKAENHHYILIRDSCRNPVSAPLIFYYWRLSLTWGDSNQWYFSSKCIMARSNSFRYLYLSNGSSTRFHCLRA